MLFIIPKVLKQTLFCQYARDLNCSNVLNLSMIYTYVDDSKNAFWVTLKYCITLFSHHTYYFIIYV